MRRALPTLLLLAAGSAAQEASLATYLPADTPLYMEFRSPSGDEMRTLAMAKVFSDPRMKALFERSRGEGVPDAGSFSSMRIPIGDAFVSVRSDPLSTEDVFVELTYADAQGERSFRIRNRVALAAVDFPKGPCPVDAVAAFEIDGDAKEAVATIERIAAAASLASRHEEGDIDEELRRLVHRAEHRGVTYAWADVGPLRICVAPVGSMIVAATGEARLKDVLDRRADKAADSLAADPRHLAMLASVPGSGTPTTQIALHVDRAIRKLQASYPQIGLFAQQMMTQLGLRDLESVTTVARVAGEGVRACTAVVLAPAEKRGGLGRFFEKGGPPPSLGGLAYAPHESLYVTCGNVDVPGLHRTAMDIGGFQLAMAVAVPLERDFGLKLKEDLCDLLGPEMTFLVAPNRGLIPDVALICESRDAARLEKNLVQLFSRMKWPAGQGVSTFKLRDVTVHAMALGHPKLGNVPVAPTFGVVDGRLVVAPYPLAFQRILAVKRGDRPSIETNPDFSKLRGVVPADAQGVSYLDLGRIFELFYDTFVPFAQAMAGGAPRRSSTSSRTWRRSLGTFSAAWPGARPTSEGCAGNPTPRSTRAASRSRSSRARAWPSTTSARAGTRSSRCRWRRRPRRGGRAATTARCAGTTSGRSAHASSTTGRRTGVSRTASRTSARSGWTPSPSSCPAPTARATCTSAPRGRETSSFTAIPTGRTAS
jgi:hypothetical protein